MSRECSRTESHILGALSKLDRLLQNPKVRTCFGAVPRTTWNSDLQNREPTRDCSQDDPYPKAEPSTRWTSKSANSDQEGLLPWWQELKKRFPIVPLARLSENRRRRVPQVSYNFEVRSHMQQLKQSKVCCPLDTLEATVIQPISIATSP